MRWAAPTLGVRPGSLRAAVRGAAGHGRHGARAPGLTRPSAATSAPAVETRSPAELLEWAASRGLRSSGVAPAPGGLVTTVAAAPGDILVLIPDALAVTTADVTSHPLVAPLAEGRGELVGLALWLLAERLAGQQSDWAPFLETLPQSTVTPMLWPPELRRKLLKGSTALAAAEERAADLAAEWASLAPLLGASPERFPPSKWTQDAFGAALAVVLAHAVYLPSAQCFALLPLASHVARRSPGFLGDGGVSATLDYDPGCSAVVLLATTSLVPGQLVVAADSQQRNSAELLLSGVELGGPGGRGVSFPGDTLTWTASLLATDRLYSAKVATLEAADLAPADQVFPVCAELGMPTQLLSYLRMSRITDTAELMKVSFDQDVIISPMNEYEVLQLMMGDCRERLAVYDGGMEDEVKLLQDPTLTVEERQAGALRLAEKRILNEVMASVRRRLAPIRGIPTKKGLESANSDLLEIFDTLENLNKKPAELLRNMLGWDENNQIPPPKSGGCS